MSQYASEALVENVMSSISPYLVDFVMQNCNESLPSLMATATDTEMAPPQQEEAVYTNLDENESFFLELEQMQPQAAGEEEEINSPVAVPESQRPLEPFVVYNMDAGYDSMSSPGSERTVMSPLSDYSSCSESKRDESEESEAEAEREDPSWTEPKPKKRGRPCKKSSEPRPPKRRRGIVPTPAPTPSMPRQKITNWLLALLESPDHNPYVMSWINRAEGEFRVMDQNELGRLWGLAKNNPKMNYENLSRAMRYYYKRDELVIVNKKLIYKFGPKASFWKR